MKKLLFILLFIWFPSISHAAISYDNSISAFGSGTSLSTGSLTINTTNELLVCNIYWGLNNNTNLTSVTANGVSMTQHGTTQTTTGQGGPGRQAVYYLYGATTGVVTASYALTTGSDIACASYIGVKQTGFPDASGSNLVQSAITNTMSVTTVADNTWTIMFTDTADITSAGTGSTVRVNLEPNSNSGLWDSNGAITPAGSHSMTVTQNSASAFAGMIISIEPYITPTSFATQILAWLSWGHW